jgi:hypothetical protein
MSREFDKDTLHSHRPLLQRELHVSRLSWAGDHAETRGSQRASRIAEVRAIGDVEPFDPKLDWRSVSRDEVLESGRSP